MTIDTTDTTALHSVLKAAVTAAKTIMAKTPDETIQLIRQLAINHREIYPDCSLAVAIECVTAKYIDNAKLNGVSNGI